MKRAMVTVAVLAASLLAHAQDVAPSPEAAGPPEISKDELSYAFGVMSARRTEGMIERLGLKKSLVALAMEDVSSGKELALQQNEVMASIMKFRSAFRDRDAPPIPPAEGEDPAPSTVTTERDKDSYAGGVFLARQTAENAKQFQMNDALVIAGVIDKLRGGPLRFDEQRIAIVAEQLRDTMRDRGRQSRRERAQAAEEAGKKFLEANAQAPGVQTLPSGLQYKVVAKGKGASPRPSDVVRAHFKAMTIEGTEFDTSYGGEPAEFPLDRVLPGWSEALQHMKVGDKWTIYVPPHLAYGDRGFGSFGGRGGRGGDGQEVPPNSTLIFELELLDIVKQG